MKIYFAGSVRGGRADQELYFSIIEELKKFGQVFTEHIGKQDLSQSGEQMITETEIWERDMAWIKRSDLVVAEVTVPSLGVGYELGQAEVLNKKIICLSRKTVDRKISAMIVGNPHFKLVEYSAPEDIKKILADSL